MNAPIDYTPATYSPDTATIWESSEGQISGVGYYVVCLLTFWLAIPIILALIRYLRIANHVYQLSGQRLLERSGILFKRTDALELYRVKDISVDQPFFQRLAGCGRIVLATTDKSTPQVILEAIPDPLAVAALLREHVEACRVQKGVREFN